MDRIRSGLYNIPYTEEMIMIGPHYNVAIDTWEVTICDIMTILQLLFILAVLLLVDVWWQWCIRSDYIGIDKQL